MLVMLEFIDHHLYACNATLVLIMPRGGATAYGSSFVCLSVIMPRAELLRHTVIVLSVRLSFTSISRRSLKTKR